MVRKAIKEKKTLKPKPKTKKKNTKKSKKGNGVSLETIKKREQSGLLKTIGKYEGNLTNLITNSYREGPIFLSKLLMVALYPQLMNSTNIHHYKEYFMLLQTDDDFRERIATNELPYSNLHNDLHHSTLFPLLHQRLLEVARECVNGGYTKKVSNSLHNICCEVSPIGE